MPNKDEDNKDQGIKGRSNVIRFEDGNLEPFDEDESGGSGSQSGEIEFRFKDDRLGPARDDKLPPNEIKRMHMELESKHKGHVENQKQLMTERAALQEGKYVAPAYGEGLSGGGSPSENNPHPLLKNKPQFDGVDKQLNSIPSLNEAKTNPELKAELTNRLTLTNEPKYVPSPPRPRSPG